MNVSRFQVCLNHDDPEIVKKGLDEFVTHILQDHDAILTFGYNGRPPKLDSTYWSTASPVINGTLSSYMRSSPRCDELFVLWSLPTRDLDKELCSSHMTCLAAILHCARANVIFSTTIVQRILRDHLKSVHMQLGSGHTSLVHATLGLLSTVARTTTQNCRDLYQKLSLQSPAFLQLVQRGKAVMWQHRNWQGEDIATDARLLITLMVFSFMKNADDSMFTEMITHTSLVKRILSSIHKDPSHTIRIVLDTIVVLQRDAPWCHKRSQLLLVESKHQQTLMSLYNNADVSVQESVHRFFVDYCTALAAALHSDGGGRSKGSDSSASSSSHSQSHARAAATNFLRLLEGHADGRHRELQLMLLKAQPSLLPRCIAAVPWVADMDATSPLAAICALGHVAHLCHTADVDPTMRAAIRKSSAKDQDRSREGADNRTDEALKATVDTLVSSLLPSALTKKDLTKLLQHPNALLQRSCLLLLHAVVKRIGRVLSEAWSGAGAGVDVARKRQQLEGPLLAALAKHLPDFQSFVTVWKKLTKEVPSEMIGEKMEVAAEVVDVDGDGDEMTGGDSEGSKEAAKGDRAKEQKRSSMLALVLQVMESLVGAAPGVVSNFDLLRLLDEVISLKTPSMSASSGSGEGQSMDFGSRSDSLELSLGLGLKCDSKTVLRTLRLLTRATSDKLCRWFGTREDAVKCATNVIVMPDWRASHKTNALSKLLCLCAKPSPSSSTTSAHALRPPAPEGLDVHVIDGQIRNQARHLLRLVLHQSGLFAGHLVANAVMCAEMCSWVDSLSLTDDSVYVTEILLRMAFHWNIEWCVQGDALMRQVLNLSRDDGDGNGDEPKVVKSARTTEAEGPAGKDAATPTTPTAEYIVAPFSPVLLCALYFSNRNFAVLCESLPKHIRSHAQGDANTDAATTFFAKYDSGFRAVLGPIITDVILSTAFGCASVDQYVHVLSHASNLIASMAAGDSVVSSSLARMSSLLNKTGRSTSPEALGRSEPPGDGKRKRSRGEKGKPVAAHDARQLQGPGNLEELVIKLKRASSVTSSDVDDHRLAIVNPPVRLVPVILDDMMEHVHVFVRQRMNSDTSTAMESGGGYRQGGGTSIDVLRNVESAFDRLWMQVALLCVRNPDMCHNGDFLLWLGHKIAHELLPATDRNPDAATYTSVDAKSTLFAQVLQLLIALGDARNDQPSSDQPLSTQVLKQVENVFSQLIAVAVDVMHSVGCTPTVAMILQADQVFDRCMSAALVGKGLRQLLIAAATLHLNQTSRSKKRSDLVAPFDPLAALWNKIADRLLEDPNRIASADIGYFGLGWLVQRFLKKRELQRVFVNSMLDDVDGFDWFEAVADSATSGGHASRAVVSSPGVRVAAVDGMLVSILKSASSSALRTLSISSMKKGDKVEAVNIFDGVIFAMSHLEGNGMVNGWMTIANILDPLSLVAGFLSVEGRGGAQEFVHHIFQNPHLLNQSPLLKLALRSVSPSQTPSRHELWKLSMLVVQLPGTVKFLGALGSKYILVDASTLQDAEKDLRKQWSLRRSESAGNEEWEQDARKLICGGDCKTEEAKQRAVEAVVDLMLLLHSQAQIASADAMLVENLVALIVKSPANSHNDVVLGICAHVSMTSSLSWIVANSRTKSAAGKVEKMAEAWVAAFETVFDHICAFLNTVLGPSIAEDGESNIVAHLVQLKTLVAMAIPVPHGGPKDGPLASLMNKLASLISSHQKKMNKLTKQLLKFTLDSEPILKAVVAVFAEVLPFGDKCTIWHNSFRPQPTDFYFPEMLLQMLVGHSKFRQVLSAEKSQSKSTSGSMANSTLISFILILVGNIKAVTSTNDELKASCKYLVTALMAVYRGSMSQNDRMVLRILHLLHRLKLSIHPSMLRVNPGDARGGDVFAGAKTKRVSAKGTSTADSKGDGDFDAAIGLSWITSAVTAARAYATISHFPLWRSSIPQPLLIEGKAQEQLYRKHLAELDALYRDEWTNSSGDTDGAPVEDEDETERESVGTGRDDDDDEAVASAADDNDNDEEDNLSQGSDQSESHAQPHLAVSMGESSDESDAGGDGDGDDDVAVDAEMHDSDEHMRVLVDLLGDCNDAVFDPCYWLPALCHVLHSEEISVRIVGNSGLLSIVLLSLSSTCPLIRSYATACLNKLLKMAKNQTQERDAAFRERPQMILLMSFVRNAIAPPLAVTDGKGKWKGSGEESFSSSAVTFPMTFSIFFARASMHLLQPTHELYGKMNKYLLSRPFCDVKDVPLYDLLVVDGEEAIHCLRMIRDGLCSHQDHLNLCRKNVYNRLMLQFPLMVKDHTNTAHAILDLLDKALSMRIASRYLIDRCNILSWLQQMASVTNSLHLTSHSSGSGLHGAHLHGSEGRDDANDDAEGQPRRKGHVAAACLAAPPRMLTRVIVLLRRCVGAVFLLCSEGVLSKARIGDALGTVHMLLDELLCIMGEPEVANQLPFDYFRQLCSLLWDTTIAQSSLCGRDPMAGEIGLNRILRVSKLVIASIRKRRSTLGENVGMAEVNEVVLSLLTLASFKLSTEPDGVPTVTGSADNIGLAFRANLCAASLRIIVSVDGASSQQPLDGKDTATKYFSIAPLNLISDFKTTRYPRECVSLMTLVQSLSPEMSLSNNEEPNFSAMLDRSWTALGAMTMESTSTAPIVAPIVALGPQAIASASALAMLRSLSSTHGHESVRVELKEDDMKPIEDQTQWQGQEQRKQNLKQHIRGLQVEMGGAERDQINATTLRWCLLVHMTYGRCVGGNIYWRKKSSGVEVEACRIDKPSLRLLSLVDQGPPDVYSCFFLDFQLNLRLCILALSSLVLIVGDEEEPNVEPSVASTVTGVALKALSALLQVPVPHNAPDAKASGRANNLRRLEQIICASSVGANSFDGLALWSGRAGAAGSPLGAAVELCSAMMGLASLVVTCADKLVRTDDDDALTTSKPQALESEALSKSSMPMATAIVRGLSDCDLGNIITEIDELVTALETGTSHPLSRNDAAQRMAQGQALTSLFVDADELFEQIGEPATSSTTGCVLFDDSRWRKGWKFGADAVARAMKKELAEVMPRMAAAVIDADTDFLADIDGDEEGNQFLANSEDRNGQEVETASYNDEWLTHPPGMLPAPEEGREKRKAPRLPSHRPRLRKKLRSPT